MDQAMAVASALNASKGQTKLRQLDGKPDSGSHNTAIVTEMQAIAHKLAQ